VTAKAGQNEGSVYFDASVGLWRGAVTLPGGVRKRVSAKTEPACKKKARKLLAQIDAGLPVESSDRLSTFLKWWIGTLDAKATVGAKSTNTVDNARWAVDRWIVPALGTKRLRDLTPEDVELLLTSMATDGRSR
jgi:hypothetical protein